MIPPFNEGGNLPPGLHPAEWSEIAERFGTSVYRLQILDGLRRALEALSAAGGTNVYIDGSFVTSKLRPDDFDACWSVKDVDPALLDPVLLDFSNARASQKAKYLGELFPAEIPEARSGKTWLEFFQIDKDTGRAKGIVAINLRTLQ
jgi:hypothetical protein